MTIERRPPENGPRRVLLIGWDAADWQMIHPLIQQGLMPTTGKLIEEGAWGNLATLRPILSPILWNSVATGKRAQHHGVLGFTEPDAEGTAVRPTSSTSRKCKALWNILTQCGLKSNVVGWYASHPAESIDGVVVTNQFETSHLKKEGLTAPVPEGTVHPSEMAEELASLRVHPGEIDATAILPLIPKAGELLKQEKHRVGKLQALLAQTATIHAVATHLMANTEWDFTAVYYEGIDRFGHEFMEFHPPKMEQVSQEDYEAYQYCMVGIYRFHDMLLDTLLKLAGEDTAVVLMSDHGYYNDHLRPDPREGKAGPTDWHRPFGIIAAQGPGIKNGTRAYGASLMEIAPTVLQLLGLPAAYDMPGRVMAEIMDDTEILPRIESWEEIEGESGMHPPETRVDPSEAKAMLQQLADLGYIEAEGEEGEISVEKTIDCNNLSLSQSLMDSNQFVQAIKVIESLAPERQADPAIQLLLANCCINSGNNERAREVLDTLYENNSELPRMHLMLGSLEFSKGNLEKALEHLQQVKEKEQPLSGLHSKLGEVYLGMKQFSESILAFERVLEIEPESPLALAGIARAKFELGEPEAALEFGMSAAELVHQLPRVHQVIGEARLALGDAEGAVEALELCVKQAPRLAAAHRTLANAYRQLGQTDKAISAELKAKGVLA